MNKSNRHVDQQYLTLKNCSGVDQESILSANSLFDLAAFVSKGHRDGFYVVESFEDVRVHRVVLRGNPPDPNVVCFLPRENLFTDSTLAQK